MSTETKTGCALVDSWGNLHWLDKEISEEIADRQRKAFIDDLGIVVNVFKVETNGDTWAQVKALIDSDRKVEAWQVILSEGKVLTCNSQ